MSVEEINAQLTGRDALITFLYSWDPESSHCVLELTVASSEMPIRDEVVVKFDRVSGLSVEGFGGGLTQLLCLRVRDCASDPWEGVRYHVEDMERHAIQFRCDGIQISRATEPRGDA